MTGLFDYMFQDIEKRNLDKTEIRAYIRYLDELILGGLPLGKELEFQAIKLKLIKRMNALNQDQIKFYTKDKEDKQGEEN